MRVIEQAALMQQTCREAARSLVFVPTMGALHEGHAALFRHARQVAGAEGTVAISIFHPSAEEMYPVDASVNVEETQLSRFLCGVSRPGHFTGVATVLTKFFNIIAPDVAIFGEKDWQQLAIVRRFVRDLNFPIEVIGYPTVREEDYLAMSSRNARLSQVEREVAPQIYKILQQAAQQVAQREKKVVALLASIRSALKAIPGATIDYVEIMNEETLAPLSEISENSKPRLFVAVKLGETRLIDNIKL